jgi:alpha-glucosidase
MDGRWWREAVVYEVYVRSFADSGGDGVGDLPGVRARLPYLRELGVDAVWLTPFYVSPQADHGYDIADHRHVDPLFGTDADFDGLLAEAHSLDLKVVVDIVPNHVSDQHPWFRAAVAAPPGDPARGRFHIGPSPGGWGSIFGGPAWSQLPDGEWYLHLFAPEQPDLNWSHPDVAAELRAVLRHWLDRGVDGIRVDAAGALTKQAGYPPITRTGPHPYSDREDTHAVYRGWRAILDSYDPPRMAVAETYGPPPVASAYVRRDELHQAFTIGLLYTPWSAAAFRRTIDGFLDGARAASGGTALPAWVLGSHDVTRAATRWPDGGAAALALTVLALPGAVYVYQGDELGLPEVDLPDDARRDPTFVRSGGADRGRDGCRVPLPWDGDGPPYGFTTGTPWLPQPTDWADRTVAAQLHTRQSTVDLYRAAIGLRAASWRGTGDEIDWLPSPPGTLAFTRPGAELTCVANLSRRPLRTDRYAGAVVLSSRPLPGPGVLPPGTSTWIRSRAA